jgi:hypothetical protein
MTITVVLPLSVTHGYSRVPQKYQAEKVIEVPDVPFPIDVRVWISTEFIVFNTGTITWDTEKKIFSALVAEKSLAVGTLDANALWEELNDSASGWKLNRV